MSDKLTTQLGRVIELGRVARASSDPLALANYFRAKIEYEESRRKSERMKAVWRKRKEAGVR